MPWTCLLRLGSQACACGGRAQHGVWPLRGVGVQHSMVWWHIRKWGKRMLWGTAWCGEQRGIEAQHLVDTRSGANSAASGLGHNMGNSCAKTDLGSPSIPCHSPFTHPRSKNNNQSSSCSKCSSSCSSNYNSNRNRSCNCSCVCGKFG
uniref:Uncharacterized protein n=1 Tax=Chlamydomonas euryale TaxID=1486919 RepID=A0A7R9VLG7_9CHLO